MLVYQRVCCILNNSEPHDHFWMFQLRLLSMTSHGTNMVGWQISATVWPVSRSKFLQRYCLAVLRSPYLGAKKLTASATSHCCAIWIWNKNEMQDDITVVKKPATKLALLNWASIKPLFLVGGAWGTTHNSSKSLQFSNSVSALFDQFYPPLMKNRHSKFHNPVTILSPSVSIFWE